jgi:dienelactone hydrolase
MIVGDRDPFFPVADVRATRDHLVKKGFTAELTEIPRHTHDYYSRSPFINEKIWSFLKTRSLEKPQRFTEYANM